MEDSDYEMTRITTELLAKTPGGNLDEWRTLVKTAESSKWYKPGVRGRANRVMQDGNGSGDTLGGGRWCSNCRTTTHSTSSCWGKCFSCGLYGHKAAQCKNPEGKEFSGAGGSVKKTGAGSGSGVEPRHPNAGKTS